MTLRKPAITDQVRPAPFDERDGVMARDDQGRYVIAWTRHLAHSPARVWRAITEQSEVRVWARGTWQFEPCVGGSMQLCLDNSLPASERVVDPGVVTIYEPPHLLEFRVGAYAGDSEQDGEHIIQWSVQPEASGCVLGFSDTFAPGRRARNAIVCGWQYMLDQLELELSPAGADWSTRDSEMERIYWRYRKMQRPEHWTH